LRELAAGMGRIVASDLPRAVESAALLAPHAAVDHSPLLRETPLPIPALGRVQLPLAMWGLLIGVRWLRDMRRAARDTHVAPRERSEQAAQWLDALADAHGSVLVVTHGAFRRYLADALESRGWRRASARRRFHHWSAWELTR
jgi:broad specificity phosphatase PhoE